jgi:hypothetical protein
VHSRCTHDQCANALPLQIGGREQHLLADTTNAVLLVWDLTAPLDPRSNPMSFPTPASAPARCGQACSVLTSTHDNMNEL